MALEPIFINGKRGKPRRYNTRKAGKTHPRQEVIKKMTDIKQTKLSTVDEFLEETGFGKKLVPGRVRAGRFC